MADKVNNNALLPKSVCSICESEYDGDEGGIQGYFGIMPVTFCVWCYSSIIDMVEGSNDESETVRVEMQ